MPIVMPVPLGGLSSEFGSLDERIRARQSYRNGASVSFLSPGTYNFTSTSFATPTGWPTPSVATNTAGLFVIAGFQILDNQGSLYSVSYQILINGTQWPGGRGPGNPFVNYSNSGRTIATGVSDWVDPTLAPMGVNTIEIQVAEYNGGNPTVTMTVSHPFIVAIPL